MRPLKIVGVNEKLVVGSATQKNFTPKGREQVPHEFLKHQDLQLVPTSLEKKKKKNYAEQNKSEILFLHHMTRRFFLKIELNKFFPHDLTYGMKTMINVQKFAILQAFSL